MVMSRRVRHMFADDGLTHHLAPFRLSEHKESLWPNHIASAIVLAQQACSQAVESQ